MSHSKMTKKGYSLYIEKWNPKAKKYINTCTICGNRGYDPSIEQTGFIDDTERRAIYVELSKIFSALPLDDYGRCADCAKRMKN